MKPLALALLLAAAGPAQAQMVKCVDERGVTHYTDKPRPGCKGGEVNIRSSPPIGDKLRSRSEDFGREDVDFRRRQLSRERDDEKASVARARQCARDRNEQARLEVARRVVTGVDAKGERVFMDDETRRRRLADLQQQTRGCP